jgi:hypothetical protein
MSTSGSPSRGWTIGRSVASQALARADPKAPSVRMSTIRCAILIV